MTLHRVVVLGVTICYYIPIALCSDSMLTATAFKQVAVQYFVTIIIRLYQYIAAYSTPILLLMDMGGQWPLT